MKQQAAARVEKKRGTAYTEEYLRELCKAAPHPCNYKHTGKLATYEQIQLECECGTPFHRNIRQMKTMTGWCNDCNKPTRNARRKATCQEKYGVDHPSQTKAAKEKATVYTTKLLIELCRAAPQPCQYISHSGEVGNLYEVTLKCNCGEEFTRVARDMREMTGKCGSCNAKDTVSKMREKCLEEHGVEWYAQVPEVREKRKVTTEERYGNREYLATDDCRQKSKATNMATRGVEYPMQCPEVKQKSKATTRRKHGVDSPFQVPEFKEKATATLKENYGVEHPLQSKELFHKQQKTTYSHKNFTFPSGRTVAVQGYEHFCIQQLLDEGVEEDDIRTGDATVPSIVYRHNDKNRYYHPDIFIVSQNRLIEVKSTWTITLETDRNRAKWLAACKEFEFEVRVYSPKGVLLTNKTIDSEEALEELCK
jgi:hypothetical protein